MKIDSIKFPIFLPDATRGVVRSLDSQDLTACGIEALVVCTYHLMNTPWIDTLNKAGGLKKFMNWDGFIVSDSGGFQIMSLLHSKKTKGKITDEGIYFQWERSGRREDVFLTPEKSIEMQFVIGADIMICLDDFAKPDATEKELTETVRKTVLWAARSKAEFERQCEIRYLEKKNRPLLLAVL
ncbi:MAG: tRNA-guanine transglycosylase, partial [Patescibacteria group bacterium]